MNRTKWIWVVVLVLIVGGLLGWYFVDARTPGQYDGLATCLKDKGVIFYGAFWCPHCQEQKKLFGAKSTKFLPYVECSTANGQDQLQVCKDAKIQSYPTWQFADGSRLSQVLTPAELAEKTTCPLPASK